jgi:two-component system NarL family sensor kinase
LRLLRSPVTLFLLIGLLTVAAIFVGVNYMAGKAASDEAIAEARRTNGLLARAVAEPAVPRGLVNNSPGALDRFDREMSSRLLIGDVERVNLWSRDGRIIYSTAGVKGEWFGKQYELDQDQDRVLRRGGTGSAATDPATQVNQDMADLGDIGDQTVQIYTRIESPEGRRVLFEAFYSLDQIEERQGEIFGSFRWITLGPLVLLILLATLILSALARQLTMAGKDRERLLRSGIDASDAERRRIARDLHDGVVQDLAGTAFSVSAIARNPETSPETRETLVAAGTSLRSSLTSLRSLLAEIHPPDLHAEGLASALADLIAPAGAVGMQASVSVEGAETASSQDAALVWRVAQEAVRNAIRHSGASTLAVTVRGDGRTLTLEVVDDGTGFDPAAVRDPDRYGLRGLRSLVADSGGTLEVRSSPGEGTTVRMEVDAP